METLPAEKATDVAPLGGRYDNLVMVFGKEFVEKLGNLKYVGCRWVLLGAVGYRWVPLGAIRWLPLGDVGCHTLGAATAIHIKQSATHNPQSTT